MKVTTNANGTDQQLIAASEQQKLPSQKRCTIPNESSPTWLECSSPTAPGGNAMFDNLEELLAKLRSLAKLLPESMRGPIDAIIESLQKVLETIRNGQLPTGGVKPPVGAPTQPIGCPSHPIGNPYYPIGYPKPSFPPVRPWPPAPFEPKPNPDFPGFKPKPIPDMPDMPRTISPQFPPQAIDVGTLERLKGLSIDQAREELERRGFVVRVVKAGDPVTMEYMPNRYTIRTNEAGQIDSISRG